MKIPQSPPKIKELLKEGKDFSLLNNPEFIHFINQVNKKYLSWEEFRYKKMPLEKKPEHVWAFIKLFRMQQYKEIQCNEFRFKYLLLDDSLRKLHLLDKGTAGYLGMNINTLNLNGKEKYIISSLMEEAIASSQIEGAATTRTVAKEILRLNQKPKDDSEQMILNGYKTMQRIVKMKDKKITPEEILELQKQITENTLKDPQDEGRFRDNNEIVVGDPIVAENIFHRPPDYEKIDAMMKDFCEFASDDNHEFIHPIIKGIILHFLIGYIHPFNDGNGRTARTIFYWYVLTRGYWLFEFMAISRVILRSKRAYGLAYLYTETDENDLTYFINFNLSAIEEALHDMEKYISRKQEEHREAMGLIEGITDINLRQAEILKEMGRDSNKSFAINEIMTTYAVVYQTARSDLLHLEKLGYIQKIKLKKKYVFKFVSQKMKSKR